MIKARDGNADEGWLAVRELLSSTYTIVIVGASAGTTEGPSSVDLADELWISSTSRADPSVIADGRPLVKLDLPPTQLSAPVAAMAARPRLGALRYALICDHRDLEDGPVADLLARVDAHISLTPGHRADLWSVDPSRTSMAREQIEAGEEISSSLIIRQVPSISQAALIAAATADCLVAVGSSPAMYRYAKQAMAYGKPPVITDPGALQYVDGSNSYPVISDHAYPKSARSNGLPDPEDLLAAIRDVSLDPLQRDERGHAAAAVARKHFSVEVIGDRMARRLRAIDADETRDRGWGVVTEITPFDDRGLSARLDEPTPRRGGTIRRGIRKLGRKALEPELERQAGTNRALLALIEDTNTILRRLSDDLARNLNGFDDFDERIASLQAQVLAAFRQAARAEEQSSSQLSDLALMLAEAADRQDQFNRQQEQLMRLLAEHQAVPFMPDALAFESWQEKTSGMNGQTVQGFRSNSSSGEGVGIEFTDAFRGEESRVKELQETYVELVREETPVLDVGAGRGEFLDLLANAEIESFRGVDLDPKMVDHMAAKGHDVSVADANEALERELDHSLGTVFSAQVIEHIPYQELTRFMELSVRKLKPGGLFIAETVNPHCVNALKAFWVDPTHEHPLFPETVLQLARSAGFASAYIFHPNGIGDVDADRYSMPAYAIVAQTNSEEVS